MRRLPLLAVLTANAISIVGTSMTLVAVPLFVLRATGSAGSAAVVAAAETAGLGLASALAGPVVDRLGWRRASVVSDLLGAVAVALMPLAQAATGHSVGLLAALAGALGVVKGPGASARHALLPRLVEHAGTSLARASGAYEAVSRGGYMLGAPLAGALIGFVDPAWVLLMDAVSFVLSAALVGTLTRPVRERQDHATGEGYLRQLRDGARYLLKDRLILAIVLMVMATNALDAGIASVLLPVYAERVLHSPLALGALLSAFGAGALLGGVLYGWLGPRLPMWPLYTVAFFLTGAPRLLTLAVDPGVPWLVAVMLGTGIAAGTLNPLLAVAELRRVPEELRSRVYGVIVAASLAGTPVGVLMAGATADGLGVRWAFVVYGVVYLLVTLCPLVFPVWRRLGEPAKGAPARPRADAAAVAAD